MSMYLPSADDETDIKCHYPIFKNILESNGFSFRRHERPYDIYHDGKDELRICDPCRKFAVNGKSILNPTRNIERDLIDFLFNKKEA